jgi:glycosyltransferase involved in cell wall biosynthesis
MESGSGGGGKVKISVYTKELLPESGGAYSFTSGIVECLKESLGNDLIVYKKTYLKKIFRKFEKISWLGLISFFNSSGFVYFPSLDFEPVQKKYVFNVWDLCHLDHPDSIDIKQGFTFEQREHLYSKALSGAYKITTGTEYTKRKIAEHYKINPEKIFVIPFPARDIFFKTPRIVSDEKEKYVFYPAQFWNHKNHRILIEAVSIIKQKHSIFINAVFTGSDKGELERIKRTVADCGVDSQIKFLGFIDDKEIIKLYDNAKALVFPSFFGPDNIPQIEAMTRGCPVICSDIPGAKEFYGNSVEYFDPSDAEDLANKMVKVIFDEKAGKDLVKNGRDFSSDKTYHNYLKILLETVFV